MTFARRYRMGFLTRCTRRVTAAVCLFSCTMVLAGSGAGWASESPGPGHTDPVALVVLALALILVVATLAGDLATRLGQPAVLGELLVGVLLGNLTLVGFAGLEHLKSDASLDMFARVGVLLLLFEVGLESTVGQMLQVGRSALLVALLGVAAPFALAWGVGAWLLPAASSYVHAFLGATLTATSVGITARVLTDLGQSQSGEARVILGAAVIDDVLGLVILAVVGGASRPLTAAVPSPTERSHSRSARRLAFSSGRSPWAYPSRHSSSPWPRSSRRAASSSR